MCTTARAPAKWECEQWRGAACKSASTEKTGPSSGIALPAAEMAAVGSRTSITGGSAPAGTILPTKSLHASCTEAMASSGFSRFYG